MDVHDQEILPSVSSLFISEQETVRDALKKLDQTAKKVLLVVDGQEHLLGSLTDGDIRRFILQRKSFDDSIGSAYNRKPLFCYKDEYSNEKIRRIFIDNSVDLVPIVEHDQKVVDYVTWGQVFIGKKRNRGTIDLPVVIMAGGRGNRLRPVTHFLPKPLIPVGEKAVIEKIIEQFADQGAKRFILSLNYKGELVEAFCRCLSGRSSFQYHYEKEPRGTVGALSDIIDEVGDLFILSNCDVLVDADFAKIIDFHREKEADVTILSAIHHYRIPYGVVNFKRGGELIDITEKPEYTFTINTGVYLISRDVVKLIPPSGVFDFPELIDEMIRLKKRIWIFPVNEMDYIDIGQWDEYRRAVEKLQLF